MIKILVLDSISVIAAIICTIIILLSWKKTTFKFLATVIVFYLILFILFGSLMFIEWVGLNHDLEFLEDLSGAILPILWIIVFYMLIEKVNVRKLEKSEERLKLVIQSANLGMWDWDVKSGHIIFNEHWTEMLGYKLNEVSPSFSSWKEMVHPEDLKNTMDLFSEHLANKSPIYKAEFRMRHKDGSWRWISTRGKIVERDENNEPVRATGINLDNTDKKRMEYELKQSNEDYLTLNEELSRSLERIHQINSELEKAKEKAEESDRLKTAFLGNISHEIRTPMNGILGFLKLLKTPDLETEKRDTYIQVIEKSGQRLLNIISDLIDISKIEEGQFDLVRQDTLVNSMIDELFLFFLPRAEEKGLQLVKARGLYLDESIVYADSFRIRQVLTNLIDNAIKFTDSGQVTIGYSFKESVHEFYVKDTGIGISPEMKETIFERFRQADNSLSRSFEGSGLGLSISKAVIELHGGRLWVDSKLGEGSTFFFTIPTNNKT